MLPARRPLSASHQGLTTARSAATAALCVAVLCLGAAASLSTLPAEGTQGSLTSAPEARTAPLPEYTAPSGPCRDLVYIGARGSGEKVSAHDRLGGPVFEGWEWSKKKAEKGLSLGYYGLKYPAHEADIKLALGSYRHKYFEGMREGIEEAIGFLGSRQRCKNEHYIFAGYSQGAMIMYRTMWLIHSSETPLPPALLDKVDGLLLIANGDRLGADGGIISYGTAPQNKNSWGVSWGFGVRKHAAGTFPPPAEKSPKRIRSRIHSVCIESDLVCDFVNATARPLNGLGIHGNAYSSSGRGIYAADGLVYVRSAATNIMKVTNSWWPLPVSPTPVPTPPATPMPTPGPTLVPTPTPTLTPTGEWKQISPSDGAQFTCGIKTDATLWCWGRNQDGQLGIGRTSDRELVPQRVAGEGWASVDTSSTHGCAVKSDGTGWCWGAGNWGQLGDGTVENIRPVPTRVHGTGWSSIQLGGSATCGLKLDRTMWCWGNKTLNGTGDSSYEPGPLPTLVDSQSWVAMDVGINHACAVRADGSAWCWGANDTGQLGDGTTNGTVRPVPVASLGAGSTSDVMAGFGHTCARAPNGALRCWGANSYGQLGLGSSGGPRLTPTDASLGGTTAASAGFYQTCAVGAGETAWCWGAGWFGQLGQGDDLDHATPVRLEGAWRNIDAGGHFGCGIRTDGTAWCWGDNSFGQLGDGTTSAQFYPVQVSPPA